MHSSLATAQVAGRAMQYSLAVIGRKYFYSLYFLTEIEKRV
jgi:hypothetical protein